MGVSAGDGRLAVSWLAPDGFTESDIRGYRLRWKGPGQQYSNTERWDVAQERHYVIEGLANGAEHFVQIAAGHSDGFGEWTEASGTPFTVPGAPAAVNVAEGDAYLALWWTAPWDGGSPITGYRLRWKGPGEQYSDTGNGDSIDGASPTVYMVEGLANGTDHRVQVAAVNAAGRGAWQEASGTPFTVPGAPASLSVAPVNGGLSVAWDAPWDGGSPITGYRLRWKGPGEHYSDTERQTAVTDLADLSHAITGLANGTEHSVRVAAATAAGSTGPATEQSGVPRTVPGRPGPLAVHSLDESLVLSWDPPASDGGSPIAGYRVQWRGPGEQYSDTERRADTVQPRHQITGLDRGSEYTVRVAAVNVAGPGPAVEAPAALASRPGPPRSLTVVPSNGSLEVTWSAPESEGGSPIVEYHVMWRGAGEDYDASDCSFRRVEVRGHSELYAAVGPLSNGISSDVRVVAVNDDGPGTPADASGTPADAPGPPRSLTAGAVEGPRPGLRRRGPPGRGGRSRASQP